MEASFDAEVQSGDASTLSLRLVHKLGVSQWMGSEVFLSHLPSPSSYGFSCITLQVHETNFITVTNLYKKRP